MSLSRHDVTLANIARMCTREDGRTTHDDALIILIALPGVELERVKVTLNTGTLVVRGERPLPPELQNARILRMEIPYGHFERRIELPPVPFAISGRHLANGCLLLRLEKGVR